MTTADRSNQQVTERRYDELYEQYGKPLEAHYSGQYLAVSPRGETILGPSILEVAQRAAARFGPGNFVYKIGGRSVGKRR